MGALEPWHWVVLIMVILVLFGGGLLPRLGRYLGRSVTGLRDGVKEGSEGFKSAIAENPDKEPKRAKED
jgi:sec-independent protein translocase protein TatA